MKILAIETSCDETSISILKGNKKTGKVKLLSQIISSQIKIHAPWGGVVPNLAAREHLKNIIPVLDSSLKKASLLKPITLSDIDLFAVTQGPGLIPALLIGVNVAKTLAYFHNKPLIGIHHIEAHIFSGFKDELDLTNTKNYPALSLVVSGGHTQLVLIKKPFDYKIIGETQDDAVGEAFDKVARILGLSYPGGPIVSQLADKFDATTPPPLFNSALTKNKIKQSAEKLLFPRPMINSDNLDFSFSGLKTAVLYKWKELKENNQESKLEELKPYICYAFQEAVVDVLITKTHRAIKKYQPRTVILAGGVAANKKLRNSLKKNLALINKETSQKINLILPSIKLCGDNATMIGLAGFSRFLEYEKKYSSDKLYQNQKTLSPRANWDITDIHFE